MSGFKKNWFRVFYSILLEQSFLETSTLIRHECKLVIGLFLVCCEGVLVCRLTTYSHSFPHIICNFRFEHFDGANGSFPVRSKIYTISPSRKAINAIMAEVKKEKNRNYLSNLSHLHYFKAQ